MTWSNAARRRGGPHDHHPPHTSHLLLVDGGVLRIDFGLGRYVGRWYTPELEERAVMRPRDYEPAAQQVATWAARCGVSIWPLRGVLGEVA